MVTCTLACWGAFGFVLWNIEPGDTNYIGLGLFYASLFLSLSGTTAIIGFLVRFIGLKKELAFRSVKVAFRQSFLFAFLIIAVMYLSSKDLFTWLNLFLLVAGLSLLEYFLISYDRSKVMKRYNKD